MMISDELLEEQKQIAKEGMKRDAEEELKRIQEGNTYNAPNTWIHEDPVDVDSQVIEQANTVLEGGQLEGAEPVPEQAPMQPNEGGFAEWHRDRKLNMNPANWAYMAGMGALDVPFDVIGLVPGLSHIDDSWDEMTKFDDEGANKFRSVASFLMPTVLSVSKYAKFLNATKLTGLTKAAANVGGVGLINGAVATISDYGEDPENRLLTHPDNFKRLAEWYPETFGPQGTYAIPEDLKTIDGTDPEINKMLAAIDETVLSGVGDLIGYAINAGKPLLWNVKPLDLKAQAWKRGEQLKNLGREARDKIIDLDQALKSGLLDDNQAVGVAKAKDDVINTAINTTESAEDFVTRNQKSRQRTFDRRALQSIAKDPNIQSFDPNVAQKLAPETKLTAKPEIPGAAAKNTIDIAAQEFGEKSRNSVPTNPITESMRRLGLQLGKSWSLVADITKKVKASGEYIDFQDKFDRGARSAAVWKIYEKIMKPDNVDALREILTSDDYIYKGKLPDLMGESQNIQWLNADATEAAAVAMSDLLDVFLGREATETSARVMSTLGKEISAISKGTVEFGNLMDDATVTKNLMDRIELLESLYGQSKYQAGWQLQNLKWWQRWLKGDAAEQAARTFEEFTQNGIKEHDKAKAWRQTLMKTKETHPELVNTLKAAYDYSDGNVDTILKLNKWAKEQVDPRGLIYSSGDGMNLFAKGAWAVTYNNVLSGLSPLRAAVGNGTALILKPITTFARAGMSSILSKSTQPWERAIYLHGSMFETTRRAMSEAMTRMAKVHSDPDFMMKAVRKDFVMEEDAAYGIIDDMAEHWQKTGDKASQFYYGWAKFNRSMARMKWMRMGMTGMAGVDAFTDTFMATFNSRLKAYDEVFGRFGKTLEPEAFAERLKMAEVDNYHQMFDKDGLLTDAAAKNASGEVALNLDDGMSTWLNEGLGKVPALKTLMMFPRTGINQVKMALSYTPIGKIPGFKSKYAQILQAGNDEQRIINALAAHGVDYANTPNAMAIYKQLRDEYEGRMMVGSATAIMGYWYAMSGNIRGNGPANASERQDLMRKGWKPYTVNIGGNWVSYKGIPMVEQMFALVGDLAYNQTALGSNLTTDFLDKLGWTISATYLNNTPLYGIEPFMAVMNGDEAAFKRLTANIARGALPFSGAHGVVANAITQAQKDIYDDATGYLLNTTIGKAALPSQIDHWTGEKINEIDNPLLRIINAANPIKVHGGEEPWRLWLINSGFDDIGILKKKFNSDVEYTAEERQAIGRLMGEDQLWKKVNKMMNEPRWNEELNNLRQIINDPSASAADVKRYKDKLPVYQRLRKILRDSQQRAEARLAMDPNYKHLDIQGTGRAITKQYMQRGDVKKAKTQSDKNQDRIKEILSRPR
mgnify:CR=1 FL=1